MRAGRHAPQRPYGLGRIRAAAEVTAGVGPASPRCRPVSGAGAGGGGEELIHFRRCQSWASPSPAAAAASPSATLPTTFSAAAISSPVSASASDSHAQVDRVV